MARTVYYAAASVDGFIADARGGVAWLDPFNSSELGYEAFLSSVGAVVLGRTTYEQTLALGAWPYADRRGLVVTSRELGGLPPGIRAVPPAELAPSFRDLRASTKGDAWVVGGGKTARLCMDAGLIDEIELYLIPCVLGDGVPLFDRSSTLVSLRLFDSRAFSNGVVMLRYAVDPGRR